jgi:hypothetical protein
MTGPLDLPWLRKLITKWDCEEWNAEQGHALLDEIERLRDGLVAGKAAFDRAIELQIENNALRADLAAARAEVNRLLVDRETPHNCCIDLVDDLSAARAVLESAEYMGYREAKPDESVLCVKTSPWLAWQERQR